MAETQKFAHPGAPNDAPPLLAADEPAPFEVYNESGAAPVLLVCDHASRFIPRALASLGLGEAELCRHIAWDIGIADVTRALARQLDAPAVLSRFSRLVVDPNRALAADSLIPAESDGVMVPGNRAITEEVRTARVVQFHTPYHAAVEHALVTMMRRLEASGRSLPALISLHSFTPVMDGFERPWHIGILWDQDGRLPLPLMAALQARGMAVGDNQPYSGRDVQGYTLRRHAEAHGLLNVLIEVRQDLIDTHHGATEWAATLGDTLATVLAGLGLREGIPGV